MSDCSPFRELTLLSSQSELPPADLARVRAHLAECESCRFDEENVQRIIIEARGAYSSVHKLDDSVRRAIALKSAAMVEKGWSLGLLLQGAWLRPGLLAAAAGALIALVALPTALRHHLTPLDHERPLQIEVVASPDSVRLAWHNGGKGAYTVYKSDNPRTFARGEAHVVRGNVWTDESPSSSNIIFYKIE